ncbi:MAG: hypothetical protein JWL82_153 [Parcubacteria group bacterium]|nr:hypothetical protein [Parcubacteria group bacterium]
MIGAMGKRMETRRGKVRSADVSGIRRSDEPGPATKYPDIFVSYFTRKGQTHSERICQVATVAKRSAGVVICGNTTPCRLFGSA